MIWGSMSRSIRFMSAYHLEWGEVFLPPDVLLEARPHGGHHVVEIHDDVDKGVEEGEEGAVTACRQQIH